MRTRRIRRSSLVAAVVVAGGVIGVQVHASPATDAAAKHCGVWRWSVKTLSDPGASDVTFQLAVNRVDYVGMGR